MRLATTARPSGTTRGPRSANDHRPGAFVVRWSTISTRVHVADLLSCPVCPMFRGPASPCDPPGPQRRATFSGSPRCCASTDVLVKARSKNQSGVRPDRETAGFYEQTSQSRWLIDREMRPSARGASSPVLGPIFSMRTSAISARLTRRSTSLVHVAERTTPSGREVPWEVKPADAELPQK